MNALIRIAIGAIAGACVGYAMYRFVGCKTGACPLTANPLVSMILYGLIGALAMAGSR